MFRRNSLPTMIVVSTVLCCSATSAWSQHTVDVGLTSPQDGQTVDPGSTVAWTITAQITGGDSLGLALISVNLTADEANPDVIILSPATDVPTGMEKFAPPDGVTNPGAGPIQAYGGTLIEGTLVQIGGGQDNSGGVQVQGGVALAAQTVAGGSFAAPATPGLYTVTLETPIANVFTEINDMPAISPVVAATRNLNPASFTFTVGGGGGACVCGDIDQSGGIVDLADFATFAVCYGLFEPSLPDCDADAFACSDLDGDGQVNLADFATFATWFGVTTTQTVPNCGQ